MERELIITITKENYDDNKISREIECIKGLFPFLESFETFATCNEVLDLKNHTIIETNSKLKNIFNRGIQKNSYIISLN